MKISVIMPTYNEKGNIVRLIKAIQKELNAKRKDIEQEYIVIDDNSPDKTADFVKKTFRKDRRVRLSVRKNERGLATAIKTGIRKSTGDVILIMDTDFNHDPKDIPLLLDYADDYDIVLGSRFVRGGGMEGAKLRWLGSYIFNLYVRIMTGLKTKDSQSGFIAVRKEVLGRFDLDSIFHGYGDFSLRMLYKAKKLSMTMKEVPVIYKKRTYGESKTRFVKHLFQYTMTVIRLRLGMD